MKSLYLFYLNRHLSGNLSNFKLFYSLMAVRSQMYELLSHCIPADVILKTLTFELLKSMDGAIKPKIILNAADYVKPCFHS